jgi:glutamate/tyrosine decarboxylase-like PLP-dependent enzyme
MPISEELKRAFAASFARAVRYRSQPPLPKPQASLEQLRQAFDIGLPQRGLRAEVVIEALAQAAEPGLIGISSPDFYGWVMGSSHPVGIAADWLVSSWGQNAGIFETSPAAAVAEEVAGSWLLDLLQLPAKSAVGFVTGATMANYVGLAAARSEVLHRVGWDLEQEGLMGAPPVNLFVGEEAHSTVLAALRYLGFGQRQWTMIPCDNQGCMRADALERAMKGREGSNIVIGQAGHIHSGGFDPFEAMIPIARAHHAWVHLDGAFGLWARASPSRAHLCRGAEGADSWAVDGHKWLQVPYDSGFAIVKNTVTLRRAMGISASYLGATPDGGRNPSDFVPELSRRARGFVVWAVLQALGRDGVAELVSRHCRCAGELRQHLLREPGIHVLNQVELNQLAISFGPKEVDQGTRDAYTEKMIAALQRENQAFVSGARWQSQWIMRVSIISQETDSEHMEALANAVIRLWRALQSSNSA